MPTCSMRARRSISHSSLSGATPPRPATPFEKRENMVDDEVKEEAPAPPEAESPGSFPTPQGGQRGIAGGATLHDASLKGVEQDAAVIDEKDDRVQFCCTGGGGGGGLRNKHKTQKQTHTYRRAHEMIGSEGMTAGGLSFSNTRKYAILFRRTTLNTRVLTPPLHKMLSLGKQTSTTSAQRLHGPTQP